MQIILHLNSQSERNKMYLSQHFTDDYLNLQPLYVYQTPASLHECRFLYSTQIAVIPLLSNPIILPATLRLIKLLILSWCLIL